MNARKKPDRQHQSQPGPRQHSQRSLAEWLSLAVAFVLLGGLVLAICVMWLAGEDRPPSFAVRSGSVRRAGGDYYYLPITVANRGDRTARQVRVEAALLDPVPESVTTVFDDLPGHGEAHAVLIFTQDPVAARIRVVSYQEP